VSLGAVKAAGILKDGVCFPNQMKSCQEDLVPPLSMDLFILCGSFFPGHSIRLFFKRGESQQKVCSLSPFRRQPTPRKS